MNDPTTLYDDLVALRRARSIIENTGGTHLSAQLRVYIERTEGRLREELKVLHEDELEETLEALADLYDESARVELEELLR